MATSTTNDLRCTTCGKAAATFMCRGCLKDFCMRHASEHRQELAKQMDEDVISFHDQLRQNFDEQMKKSPDHSLMKQIDEWERNSIEKIRQTANDARQQLLNIIDKHMDKLKNDLECLTQELKKARDDDNFFENDLNKWITTLNELKKDLITPQTINVHYDNDTTSFISKIIINEKLNILYERFEQFFGDIFISDNGTVVTHNGSYCYASVRGKYEYTSGKHQIRFQIKHLSNKRWIFFGISYRDTPAVGYGSIGKTGYGFSGEDNVWYDGSAKQRFNGYTSDFEINDIIELLINCDQRTISLINERTHKTHVLDVDITNCPFPWKMTVGLYFSPGDSVCILP
ncbi:unnamed protein product [Rotaria sordida]|uniref:B30.2/SPRY domain-containing protein n=1 Tax=Rotaria sordida TaxID=392033 RepID=A0A814RYW3_9BILA|nr:unnamed protein product [Rotaria sordida]CAF1368104.1 unnamed protein product [Rotaria sordida]